LPWSGLRVGAGLLLLRVSTRLLLLWVSTWLLLLIAARLLLIAAGLLLITRLPIRLRVSSRIRRLGFVTLASRGKHQRT
jgi:hypothetical protein